MAYRSEEDRLAEHSGWSARRANMFVSVDLYRGYTPLLFRVAARILAREGGPRASRSAAAKTCFNFRRCGASD